MEIIDFRTRPRTKYFFRDIVPEPIPAFKSYFALYSMSSRLKLAPMEESVAEMRENGISKGVIFPGDFNGFKEVYQACKDYPDAYIPLAEINIKEGVSKGVKDLEFAYKEYNFHGLTLSPFIGGIYPTDSRYYPLYSLSERLCKLVQIHSSTHFNPDVPLDIGNPNHLDKIAVHFPELKLVLAHGGMGFEPLGVTVAQRHQNMFIDFTGLRPKYLSKTLVYAINTILKRKAIFGTNYPSLPYSIVEEWKEVISPENQPYFFYKNAARALGLDGE